MCPALERSAQPARLRVGEANRGAVHLRVREDRGEAGVDHAGEVVRLVGCSRHRCHGSELPVADAKLLGALLDLRLERLPPALDRLERRAQLHAHCLEALAENSDLTPFVDPHLLLEIAAGHGAGGPRQDVHGPDE